MSGTERATSGSEVRLARILDDYLAALQRGAAPDRSALLAAHPDLAEDLEVCLASLEFIRHATPPSGLTDRPAVDGGGDDRTGGRLGDFRIVRELGRGGMGVVYEAEQESLGRRVALKVLPFAAALDSRQLQRFKVEAMAAAQLHHTHIVPVFSVGVAHGVHYYAMQFIDGRPLSDDIDELRRLHRPRPRGSDVTNVDGSDAQPTGTPASDPTALAAADEAVSARATPLPAPWSSGSSITGRPFFQAAVRLGIQAAEALEYAHSLGVVHRDIKPANFLIDTRGELWVTDFGLARFHADTGLTLTGDVLGTLRYMSPEQALGRRAAIDHRTDIYSLGVTLYELLTLRPALDGRDRQELLRQMAFEEPRPPRRVDPTIPRELETVVLKAMTKEPEGRYASAQEVADDLQRFLEHRPIKARRPSLPERAAKWSRRHRTVVASTLLLLVMAVVGLAIGYVLVSRERERDRARERFELAWTAVEDMYTQVAEKWLAGQPGLEPVQRDFLLKALAFYQRFARERGDDPVLMRETAKAYKRVASIQLRLGQFKEAETASRAALERYQALAADRRARPEDRRLLGEAYLDLATLLMTGGRNAEGEQALRRSLELLEPLLANHPSGADDLVTLASAYDNLALLLREAARTSEAERAYQRSAELLERLKAHDPKYPEYLSTFGGNRMDLGVLLLEMGRVGEAEQLFRRALPIQEGLVASNPGRSGDRLLLGKLLFNLGTLLPRTGDNREAGDLLRRALDILERLASDYPRVPQYGHVVALARMELGNILAQQGRLDEAEDAIRRATEQDEALAAEFPELRSRQQLGAMYNSLGRLLQQRGRLAEAEREYHRALAFYEKLASDNSSRADFQGEIGSTLVYLGSVLLYTQRFAEAVKVLRRASEVLGKVPDVLPTVPKYRLFLADADRLLGDALALDGHIEEAWASCKKAIVAFDRLPPEFHHEVVLAHQKQVMSLHKLGTLWKAGGRHAEAIAAFRQAEDLCVKLIAKVPDQVGMRREQGALLDQLGLELAAVGQLPEAERVFHQAVEIRERSASEAPGDPGPRSELGDSLHNLATSMMVQDRDSEAIPILHRAISLQEEALKTDPKSPRFRQLLRNHIFNITNALMQLGRHAEAAEAAARLVEVSSAPGADAPFAATVLGQCSGLAEKDDRLTPRQRELAAQSYRDRFRELIRREAKRQADYAPVQDNLSRLLVTAPDSRLRDPAQAVELAQHAVALAPKQGTYWDTLGEAQFLAGDWKAAVAALEKAMQFGSAVDARKAFLLTLAYWHEGDREQARRWYARAVDLVERGGAPDPDLSRLRDEAARLGLTGPPVDRPKEVQTPMPE